jgi:hypothetical protein
MSKQSRERSASLVSKGSQDESEGASNGIRRVRAMSNVSQQSAGTNGGITQQLNETINIVSLMFIELFLSVVAN